jgi:catalase (peroxidase I)
MNTARNVVSGAKDDFEGQDRATGKLKWTGTRINLVFGSKLNYPVAFYTLDKVYPLPST